MPTEYANSRACRAAGVEPVPQVGDCIQGVETGWTRRVQTRHMNTVSWWGCLHRLVRRGDVTIPQHSDTKEGE